MVRGLFAAEEVEQLRDHYMGLRRRGSYDGDVVGVQADGRDPLRRYPRMAQMHRWDELSLQWMIDDRLDEVMTGLLGRSPYAVQTMIYFKPPGSRGQALHQDNFYLKAEPGTCVAAWMALDKVDVENGCLEVVPGVTAGRSCARRRRTRRSASPTSPCRCRRRTPPYRSRWNRATCCSSTAHWSTAARPTSARTASGAR